MRADDEVRPPGQVDPKILHRLFYVDHLCLVGVAIIALINIFPIIFAQTQHLFPGNWPHMRTWFAVMTLCAAMSLILCEETQATQCRWAGRGFGILAAIIASASFLAGLSLLPVAMTRVLSDSYGSGPGGSLAFSAAAFLLVAVAILFTSSQKHNLGRIADGIAIVLSPLVLALVVNFFFGMARIQGSSAIGMMTVPSIWCLVLLTVVVLLRRAEQGFLTILWGFGTGSRIARIGAPILLLLPLVREILRAHLLKGGLIPPQYAGTVLTTVGTVLGFILLLFFARVINRMQRDIQGANLRDELTGLQSVSAGPSYRPRPD